MCFQDRLGEVLRTSWGRPETTSQGSPLDVRLERLLDVRLGRPQDVISRLPLDVNWGRLWDGQIGSLGGRPWEVGGGCWGPTFVDWVVSFMRISDPFPKQE